jgi:archaeosine synthase beta-subunit
MRRTDTNFQQREGGNGSITQQVLALRPERVAVDPYVPYAFVSELEQSAAGLVEPVSTLFLTNRECPFRCVMCDLWRHTLDTTVPLEAIPVQIDYAISRLPLAKHIKLYNSGNFFDAKAIPPASYAAIAARLADYQTVIVENHPALLGDQVLRFRDMLPGHLELAMGLETVHPNVLPRLNKQMTLDQFERAVEWLLERQMSVRAFVLLQPPFMEGGAAVEWAVRSVEFAVKCGARVVSIVPTRGGNGMMEALAASGDYTPPTMSAIEETLATCLQRFVASISTAPRVFMDTWDLARFASCSKCVADRVKRIEEINWQQVVLPPVSCCECQKATSRSINQEDV